MTSTLTNGPLEAGQVSPGVALTPVDSDARADYLQERLGLLAALFSAVGTFFLVAACLHQWFFFDAGPLARPAWEPALLTHLGLIVLQALVWRSSRCRRWSARLLPWLDTGLIVGSLTARAYEVCYLSFGPTHHLHLLMSLTLLAALLCRSVVVPSKPRTTSLVGLLAVIPVLAVAAFEGATRGSAAEAVSFTAIWCATAVALSSFASKVIYGLRHSAQLNQQLGQYVIERKLGEGGMGEVYLARHTLLRRPTALKLLPPERAGLGTIARFEREVRATSRLSHPNTVAIYDYGRTREGIFYYAMEHLDGCDLQRLVEDAGPLCPSRVVHILVQVAGALSEAHQCGLIHRDLKPANVFLCERGGLVDTVKVLDFGLVKETGSERLASAQTDANLLMGTPAYLSPEAIHSPAEVDARSDLYAVGALAYFLLTGSDVFEAKSVVALCVAHLGEVPRPPSERLRSPLPRALEALIMSCLEKRPEQRPQSAAALRRALLACDVPVWDPENAGAMGCAAAARATGARRARHAGRAVGPHFESKSTVVASPEFFLKPVRITQ